MRKKVTLNLSTAVTVPTSVRMLARIAICGLILLLATVVVAQQSTPEPARQLRAARKSRGPRIWGGPGPAVDLTGDPAERSADIRR